MQWHHRGHIFVIYRLLIEKEASLKEKSEKAQSGKKGRKEEESEDDDEDSLVRAKFFSNSLD